MSVLNNICSLCLKKERYLLRLHDCGHDKTSFFKKLTTSIPEMCFQELHDRNWICTGCCINLDAVHNFRNKCIKNKPKFLKYIAEIQTDPIAVNPEQVKEKKTDSLQTCLGKNSDNHIIKTEEIHLNFKEELLEEHHNEIRSNVVNTHSEKGFADAKHSEQEGDIVIVNEDVKPQIITEKPKNTETIPIKQEPDDLREEEEEEVYNPLMNLNDPELDEASTSQDKNKLPIKDPKYLMTPEEKTALMDKLLIKDAKKGPKERRYACDECDKKFLKFEHVIKHKRIHSGERPFACRLCDKKFIDSSKLHRHMRFHTGELKLHKCEICKKTFSEPWNLKKHIKTHKEKTIECSHCKRKFSDTYLRNLHFKKVHTEKDFSKEFSCELCSKVYHEITAYKRHKLTHFEAKFECDVCFKKFTDNQRLRIHKNTHTGFGAIYCKYCNRKFLKTSKSRYERHIKMHNGELDLFRCNQCEKTFFEENALKRHLLVHSIEKPFSCEFCDLKFKAQNSLRSHKKVKHKEHLFRCGLCENVFLDKQNYERHKKIHIVSQVELD